MLLKEYLVNTMIVKGTIFKTLKDLDRLFTKENDPTKQLFYSKLALMELCGWIEVTMDNIVEGVYKKNISNPEHIKKVQSEIRRNSNFHYEDNFKKMLSHVIGLSSIEEIEKKATQQKLLTLKATLESLKAPRNSAAHTFIKGAGMSIDAPSVTLSNFMILFEGFKDFKATMKIVGLL